MSVFVHRNTRATDISVVCTLAARHAQDSNKPHMTMRMRPQSWRVRLEHPQILLCRFRLVLRESFLVAAPREGTNMQHAHGRSSLDWRGARVLHTELQQLILADSETLGRPKAGTDANGRTCEGQLAGESLRHFPWKLEGAHVSGRHHGSRPCKPRLKSECQTAVHPTHPKPTNWPKVKSRKLLNFWSGTQHLQHNCFECSIICVSS